MNHYEVLGMPTTASAAELRRAYLDLARRFHPDFHANDGPRSFADAEDRMREINLAWEVLGDRRNRIAYDRRIGVRTSV